MCGHDLLRNPHGLDRSQNSHKTKPKLNTRQAAHNEDNFAVPEQWQDGVSNSTEITIKKPWNRDCRGGIEVDQCVLKSM